MAARRINPRLVKKHRSYTASELAVRLDVHKNTIRNWERQGLEPLDKCKPKLFAGANVRAFHQRRNAERKRRCPRGTFFCLRCREPRKPADGHVVYTELRAGEGNLKAICEDCSCQMHRAIREADIPTKMPGLTVQFSQAQPSLIGKGDPSLNCDNERKG